MPYQVLGQRSGADAVTIAWIRLAMARSRPFMPAIASSRARSPSALFLLARASAFCSWARAFIAARSSAVNAPDDVAVVVLLLVAFGVVFFAGLIMPPSLSARRRHA